MNKLAYSPHTDQVIDLVWTIRFNLLPCNRLLSKNAKIESTMAMFFGADTNRTFHFQSLGLWRIPFNLHCAWNSAAQILVHILSAIEAEVNVCPDIRPDTSRTYSTEATPHCKTTTLKRNTHTVSRFTSVSMCSLRLFITALGIRPSLQAECALHLFRLVAHQGATRS